MEWEAFTLQNILLVSFTSDQFILIGLLLHFSPTVIQFVQQVCLIVKAVPKNKNTIHAV